MVSSPYLLALKGLKEMLCVFFGNEGFVVLALVLCVGNVILTDTNYCQSYE